MGNGVFSGLAGQGQATPVGDAFAGSLRDILAGMAMGTTPNESMAYAGKMLATQGAQRQKDQQAKAQQGMTLNWLKTQGIDPGTASYLVSDPQALRAWFGERQKGQTPDWQLGEIYDKDGNPQKIMYDKRDPSRYNVLGGAKSDELSPGAEAQKIRIGQASKPETHVTVGGGRYGTIPPGYQLNEGPAGASMTPIPGGPAAIEAAEKAKKAETAQASSQRAGDIVLADIDKALEQSKKGGSFGIPVTGSGSMLSGMPGSAAHDLENRLNTIKSNISFDKLQAMRAASPTGGALGAVSDFENKMLQATFGALEQSQSRGQFEENLKRLKKVYTEIVHGPGAASASAADPLGIR